MRSSARWRSTCSTRSARTSSTHGMQFVDWDGRPTQYGKVNPDAGGDTPGYLAVLGASFLATAARGTDDPALDDCLRAARAGERRLSRSDPIWTRRRWLRVELERPVDARPPAFHHLMWNDSATVARAVPCSVPSASSSRPRRRAASLAEHNAWYDVMWAAQKPLGPGTDGPAYAAVEDAVCAAPRVPALESSRRARHDATRAGGLHRPARRVARGDAVRRSRIAAPRRTCGGATRTCAPRARPTRRSSSNPAAICCRTGWAATTASSPPTSSY